MRLVGLEHGGAGSKLTCLCNLHVEGFDSGHGRRGGWGRGWLAFKAAAAWCPDALDGVLGLLGSAVLAPSERPTGWVGCRDRQGLGGVEMGRGAPWPLG